MTDDIARTIIADLLRVGTQAMTHRYRGQCPDVPCKGPEHATSRDPLCAACKALTQADVWMAGGVETEPPTRCADPGCRDARFPHHHEETTAVQREHGLTVTTYLPPTPSRARLIVDGHSVMCAEFGGEGPTKGCPGCALPPRSLSAQVRARLGKGDLSLLMNTSRPGSRIFSATWHREYQDGVVSDRRDAEGPDVDACLRAVLAWEDRADREQPEHAPPALPGPTEHVDMALRFRYRYGGFVVQSEHSAALARPDHYSVHGLAIRIVYEHRAADAEAAQDCAESWRSRMLGAGAREVECVGEVVT